ncbi:MAG: hypothetical protein DMG10_26330 [Acidobacteria bacterium]|nr:MAG: hypothetical protein DMG10_26330 [Acidobacteriota bacterium]
MVAARPPREFHDKILHPFPSISRLEPPELLGISVGHRVPRDIRLPQFDLAIHFADESVTKETAVVLAASLHPLETTTSIEVDRCTYAVSIGYLPCPFFVVGGPILKSKLTIAVLLAGPILAVISGAPDLNLVWRFLNSPAPDSQTLSLENGDCVAGFVPYLELSSQRPFREPI